MTQELPTGDEFFSEDYKPTADEFFAAEKPSAMSLFRGAINAPSQYNFQGGYTPNPAVQDFLKGTTVGRIMNAFSTGAQEQLEGGNLGYSQESEKMFRETGVWNDHSKGEFDFMKALNEGLMVPAAAGLDAVFRGANAVMGGIGSAVLQGAEEIGGPAPELAEYMLNSPIGAEFHPPSRGLPPEIAKARNLGVIGEGEAGYFGTKEPTPAMDAARKEAESSLPVEPEAPKPTDIHEIARTLDPETFKTYDRLSATREDLRSQLSNLSEQRTADIDAQIKEIQDAKKGGYGKLQKLLEKREDITSQDTLEMAELRKRLQETDYQMRDLSPKVSEAYRTAHEKMPQEDVAEPGPEPQDASAEVPQEPPIPEQPGAPVRPIEEQRQAIISDISQKLTTVGRPAEEINALAQLEAARYETLAAQYPKFSAEEWYNRESANIRAGRERARVLAQEDKPILVDDKSLETRLNEKIGRDFGAVRSEYERIPDTNGGKILNTDSARELSEDYLKDRSRSAAVHEPASEFIKRLYREKLAEAPKPGEDPTVLFTAGGTGSGKSTAVKQLLNEAVRRSQIVYDTNMNKLESSVQKIEQALAAGKDVKITYVYRDVADALQNGALPRAMRQEAKHGTGRTVPIKEHINTHVGSLRVIKELAEHYRDNPKVEFTFIDNSRGLGKAAKITLDQLPKIEENGLKQKLKDVLHGQYQEGKISKRTRQGFLHGEEELSERLGSTDGGRAEQGGLGRGSDELSQGKKGSIRLATDDARATITLMKSADASTLIHEKGHEWADQLIRLSREEGAPAQLKKDAETLLKYGGADESGHIPRRGHEKIARGFERYLMEGVAPSKALAGVFAKFKQWLTQLYQTVERLRSPISDDIRDVFDRLLSKEPQKTVIAPDHHPGATLARIHEADAETTPPEKAAGAADNIRTEVKSTARQHDKEVADVIDTAEKNAGNEADIEQTRGPEAETPGQRAPDQQPAAVPAGGAEVAGEGGAAREPGTEPGKQTDANATLGRPDSTLVDKAGNIRLDNLNTPEDVNQVLRQTASENNDFIRARRGVISDAQAIDLADALGMDAKTLNLRKIGEAFNSEQIIAARKLLIQSATSLRDAMAKAATGADTDVMAYAEAKARHMMIQEQVSGITAEAGRALRAFRSLEGSKEAQMIGDFLKQTTGQDLFQLKEEAKLGATLDTPQKLSKFINDSRKASFTDMLMEFWINSLLSGPVTHVTNIVSNTLIALNAVPETALASVFSKVLQSAERVELGEAKARLFGVMQGSQDGMKAAWNAFKNEETAEGSMKLEQRKFQAIPSAKVNIGGKELELGGKQIRIPGRLLTAEDEFFKTIATRQELNVLAYRQATKEGLSGDRFAQRIADLVLNPTEEMMKKASVAANYQTFTNELGATGQAIQRFANSHPLLKVVIPFVRTPTNILKYAGERSLLGLFSSEVRQNLSGVNGTIARDTQLARMTLGTTIGAGAMTLAAQGYITGGGPVDSKQRAVLYMTGWQPYSVRIGSMYYSYARLEPFGTLAGVPADMVEIAQHMEDTDIRKLSSMLLSSISKNVTNKTWLQGPSDLIQAISDPDRYGEQYVRNLASTVIPTGVAQVARSMDPTMREARTLIDTIKAKVPGLSQDLFPRRDIWGNPIVREGGVGPDLVSPIYETAIKNDPVNQRLLALGIFPSRPERKIRGVELTDQQYDDYSKMSGKLAKLRLNQIVAQPGFSGLPAQAQIEAIRKTIDTSRESTRSLIMMQNPSIMRQATENKMAILQGKKPAK